MELLDAMRTTGGCREYRPDPVPEAVFYRAVEAARFGPQGGNRQPVRFLVVTDPAAKRQLGAWYLGPWREYMAAARAGTAAVAARSGDAKATWIGNDPARVQAGLDRSNAFAEAFGEVPAIVVVCADLAAVHPTDTDLGRLSIVGGASVYPIVQNFCLALRGEGVATRLTTLLCSFEPQVKELLGIPAELSTAAFLAAGYPAAGFPQRLRRRAVEKMAFLDSFDRPLRP
jgi:nitroreductase